MKIKCYCVGCSKHPLYEKRKEFKDWVVGHDVFIWRPEHLAQGADVECFNPQSGFFDIADVAPENVGFKELWYGDGSSFTQAEGVGYTAYATCVKEDYEGMGFMDKTTMTLEEILAHNKSVKTEYWLLHKKADTLAETAVAPCKHCPYDGDYRCSSCSDNFYEGFNIKGYP